MEVQLLKDLLATAIEDNYDWDTIMPKFPELKDVDTQLLKDYAATAIEDNYDYSVINPKFPEFFGDSVKKKVVTTTTAYPLGQENTSTTLVTGNPNQEQGTPSVSLGSTEYKPSTIKDIGERPNETTINPITEKPYNINNMMEAASLKKIQQDWDRENAKNTLGRELSVEQQSGVEKIKEQRQKDKELASQESLQSRIKKSEEIQSEIEKQALSKTRPTKESINPATGKVYGDDLIGEKELLRDQLLFDQQQDIAKIQSTKYDYLTPELFTLDDFFVAEFLNAREDLNKNFIFEPTGFNLLGNSDFIRVSTVDKNGNKNGMREYTFEIDIDEGAEKNIEKLKVFLDRNRRASLEDRSRAQQEIVSTTGQVVPSQRERLKENMLEIDPLLGPTVTDATQLVLPPVTVPEWQLSLNEQDKLSNARGVILSETATEEAELKATANIDKIKEKFKLTTRDKYSVEQFQEDLKNAEDILTTTSGSNAAALTNEINSSISTALNDNALQLKDINLKQKESEEKYNAYKPVITDINKREEKLTAEYNDIISKQKKGEEVAQDVIDRWNSDNDALKLDIEKLKTDFSDEWNYKQAVLERDIEDLTMNDSELNVLMKDIEDNAAAIALINEREGSKSGIITNNLIRGGGTFLRMLGADRTLVEQIVREASDPSTTPEYEKSGERTFTDKILATLSNMAGIIIPSTLAGPFSGYVSAAGFMAQAKYQLRDEMDDNPDFNYMSDSKKEFISNLYGGVVGLLERYGLSKMISKSPLSKKATLVVLRDVLQNLPKTVTTETMTKAIQATTKRLIANGGIQVLAAGSAEASTEVAQSVFEMGLKEVVNSMEGADLFKQDLSGQAIFENLFEAGALGFAAGGLTQGASQAASITKQGFKNSGLSEKISNSVLSLNRSKEFRSTMSNYFKTKILQGEITREEALKSLKAYDIMMGRANKIPSNIENITEAFDLITERANIESEIEGKDPALIVKQKERIKEINSELGALTEKAPMAEEVTETKEATKKKPGDKDNVSGVDIVYPTDKEAEERKAERTKPEYVDEAANKNEQEDVEKLKGELEGEFGILTGENPLGQPLTDQENTQLNEKAEAWLKGRGYTPRKVTGKYGQAENSFIVPNLTKEDAIAFAKEFNQESVAHSEGMVYQDGSMNPRVKTEDNFDMSEYTPESDFVSVVNTPEGLKTFSIGYDFDTKTDPAPTVEAAPKVEAEPTVKAKNTEKQKTKIRKQVDRAKRSVRSVLKNVEFIVHESDADFVKATGSSDSGAFERIGGKFKIHVNMDKANNRTVGHEVFHALLLSGGITDSQARKMTGSMLASVRKVASPEMLAKLDKFAAAYPEKLYSEESIAELFGIISEHYSELNDSGKSAIKEWLAKLVKALKLDKIINVNSSILEASNDEVIEFLDAVAKKVATGQEIVEGDVSILSEAKDDTAGVDTETRKRRQAEDLFLSDKKKKFDSLKDVAKFLDSWSKENKLFEDDLKNISDEKIVDEFVKHIELELKAWEKVRKDNYVSFYDNDIIEKTNPTLQDYAKKEYGRPLTDTEVKLYHIVSAFASPSANPEMDSWKGFDIFDRFMKTGELSGYSDKIATVWETLPGGKRVDTGKPRLDKEGKTMRSKVTPAYSQTGLDKFNTLIDKMGGDLNKAMDWITSTHSYAEISKMFEFPEKGPKALKQNEYMSKEDGGLGVFGMTGAKLGSYILNRFGNFSTVTKDMWYARTMARLAGQDLVTENKKTQKKGAIKTPWAESTKEGRRMRTLADKAFKELANRFNTSPAMIQERIWDFEKRMYEKLGANEDAAYTSDGLKKGIERASQKDITRQQKTGSAYFSNALKAAANIKDTNPKQPVQWVKALTDPQKNGGVGGVNQELKWIGLEDYLTEWQKENKVKSVPQNIVEDYINDNQIEIIDVTLKKEVTDVVPFTSSDDEVKVVEDNDGSYILQDQEGNRLMPDDKWSSKEEAEDDAIYLYPDSYHSSIEGIPSSSRPTTQNITNNTKYESYTLDGGENYQEVLLTLPNQDTFDNKYNIKKDSNGNYFLEDTSGKVIKKTNIKNKQIAEDGFRSVFGKDSDTYRSSHWDEANILAHLRLNERTLPNGEKVMFIEEVQSDWAQEGKKRGFATPENKVKKEEAEKKKQEVLNSSKSYELLNKKTEGDLFVRFFDAIQQKATDMIDNPYYNPESRKERFLEEYQERLSYWGKYGAVPKMSKEEWANFYDVYLNELSNNKKKVTGYSNSYKLADISEKIEALDEEIFSYEQKSGTPDMPYKKTDQWVGLAIRRVMKMAADKGFDRIAWVTGEQSADRYDLSKQVSEIRYFKTKEGLYELTVNDNNYTQIITAKKYSENELENVVGKEMALKIINNEGEVNEFGAGVLSGLDLKVGGEGMKTFYNSIVPKVALAEAKRFDKKAKVDVISLPNSVFKEEVNPPTTKQLSIAITPEMNQKLEGGIGVTRQQKVFRAGDLTVKAEPITKFELTNRSTGHFGTGFYFFGKRADAETYAKGTGTETSSRIVSEIDLNNYNLAKATLSLHEELKRINNNEFNDRDITSFDIERIAKESGLPIKKRQENPYQEFLVRNNREYEALISKYGEAKTIEMSDKANRIDLDTKAPYEDIVNDINKKLKNKNNKDTRSTLVMKALGFEGVNATGTDLDNSRYGTVVYDIKPKKDITRQQKINWEVSEEGKGDPSISSRDDVVSRAAKNLKEGKISNKKWREIVNKRSPITPITRFFDPATLDRMKSALNVRQMPLINAVIKAGAKVGIRLDINAYKNKNTWVVSIHNNENNLGVAGKVISYRNVAKIKNVRFDSSEISTPRSALNIATGDKNKATIARIYGDWVNFDGKNSEEQAENAKKEVQDIVNSKEWVQIGMNPFRHSYFYDRSTVDKDGKIIGDPVKTADELLQIGGLVYAKNPTYGKWTDKEYIVQVKNQVTKEMQPLLDSEGDAIRFQKDGDKFVNQPTIEEIIRANPDSSVLDVNKELVRVGYSKEQIQKYREKEEGVYNPKTGSIKVDRIIKSVNSFRKRMLSARSLLPKSWYKFLEQKEANIAYHLRYSEKLAKLYNKEIGKYKGDKKELAEDFDAYLRGKRYKRVNKKGENEYFKNKVKGGAEIVLPEKIQGVAVSMRNHVDALSQSLIDAGIVDGLSAENVQNNMGEYLTTSYKMYRADNWRDQVSDQVKQAAKNYIEQNNRSIIKDIAKEEGLSYTEAAKQYVDAEIEKILQKGEEGSFATKRGVSKDLSILKRKKDIDPAIQNLMGIYNEPGLSYLETVMKVSALQAQHNYLSNIRKSGEGVFLFSRAKGKFTYKIASDTNDAMAPLNGLYTTKELKDELEASTKELSGFLKNYMKVVGAIKYGKTILSPATHAKNIFGNLGFMFVNGHFNPVDWASAFNTLVRDSISLTESEYSRKMDEYIKVGVAGQSAGLGELKAMLNDATSKGSFEEAMIDRLSRKSLSVKQRIGKGIGKAGKFFENAYQAEDDLFKIIAYESEKARHLKVVAYEENKKVSELTDKEIERAKEMAAEKVKNTLPTYSRVPYIIQMARKSPLVGSFVAFHAESFRTAANTAVISMQEATSSNPELRMIGAKRIAGTGAYLAAKAGILSAYSWGVGAGIGLIGGLFDDEEERQIQKDIARFLPSYSKDSNILVTSIKPGEVKYVDTSASDPHGSLSKMLNAFLRSDTTIEGVINSARAFLDPILGLEIATEAVQNLFNNQDVYGRRIYDETDTVPDIIYDVSLFIAKVMEPGGLTSVRRIIRADDPRSEIIGATTGYREREIELKNDGRWLIIEKVEAISESMKSYNSIFNKYERNILSKYEGQKVSEKDIVTKEMVIKEYKEANRKVRALQKELIEIWNSLDRLGMTPINKLQLQQYKLFQNSGISQENIQNIGNNKIYDIKPKEGEGGIGNDIDYGDIITGEKIIEKY